MASADLNNKTIIFVALGTFDVDCYVLNITKNVHIVGNGRDGTIFTNTYVDARFVLEASAYFKIEHCAILFHYNCSGINIIDDCDAHLIHMKFTDGVDEWNYEDYPAIFSFDDGKLGFDPLNFTCDDFGAGNIAVRENLDGHERIVELEDTNGADFVRLTQEFTDVDQESGYVEWWWRTDEATDSSQFYLDDAGAMLFLIAIQGDDFDYYDGGWNEIESVVEDDTWYHMKVAFECGTDEFMGLDQYTYYVFINYTRYGAFPFWNNRPNVDMCGWQSDAADVGYSQFIDAVDYSWVQQCALQLDSSYEGEFEDLFFRSPSISATAINLINTHHNHFWTIEIHESKIGVKYHDNSTFDNHFDVFNIHRSQMGLDKYAGQEQHYHHFFIDDCDWTVCDRVGDSFWYDINTDIMEGIITPDDLIGISIKTGPGAFTYAVDKTVYNATCRIYYIVAILYEPYTKEKYTIRFTEDGGLTYFYTTIVEVKNANEVDRLIIVLPRIFNAWTEIQASAMSETGNNGVDFWLEIILI